MSWSLFISAFTFIFLAALPGRTTFVMLLMAARGKPRAIFFGAALAFTAQSFISVCLGHLLAFLSPRVVHLGAGFLFLYFAFHFWRDSRREMSVEIQAPTNSFRTSFLLIFAAEWGDVSQIAIASFSASHHEQLTIFLSAVLALWSIAGLAIVIGANAGKVADPKIIQRLASIAFGLTGIYLIAKALEKSG